MENSTLTWEVERRVIEIQAIEVETYRVELKKPEWAKEIAKYIDTGKLPTEKED